MGIELTSVTVTRLYPCATTVLQLSIYGENNKPHKTTNTYHSLPRQKKVTLNYNKFQIFKYQKTKNHTFY